MTAPDLTQGERLRIAAMLADAMDEARIDGEVEFGPGFDVHVHTRRDRTALGSIIPNITEGHTGQAIRIERGSYMGVAVRVLTPVGAS